jgi:hypothetical protein
MTGGPNDPWYACLPSCETRVPCGAGTHPVRWEAGTLQLPEHADAEAELVLAALGGEKARCVEVAQIWDRHTSDLSVLSVGPRTRSDEIVVDWDVVAAAAQESAGHGRRPSSRPMLPAGAAAARLWAGQQEQQYREQFRERRHDILSLLALGYDFGARLAAQVAEAHADRLDEQNRPTLGAAVEGRLVPVAEQWLGLDPGQIRVTLHTGPGWGSVQWHSPQLEVALPARWLSRVWAPGLAVVGRHLVVAVDRAGWPDARVLALRAPGTEPVQLEVHAAGGPPGAQDEPHWEI